MARVEPAGVAVHPEGARHQSGIIPARPPLSGVRCLIIEDEMPSARALVRLVTDFGARPLVVGSVREALRALMDERWDLLLVDLRLPDGSGETVVRAARRLRPAPAIVVASGHFDPESRVRLQLCGALVADKGEFAVQLRHLAVEALRRSRAARRRTHGAPQILLGTRAMPADPEASSPSSEASVPVSIPPCSGERPAGASVEREAAVAEFSSAFRFSQKEHQIFALSFSGSSDKDIAGRLGIAHGTVRTNWVRMARKVGGSGGVREVMKHFARWCAELAVGAK